MARRSKREETHEEDLNLAPIMNMVIILIPLLLLSVVFLKVSVINVSSPGLTTPDASTLPEEPTQKITVTVSATGFYLATSSGPLPAIKTCPSPGPTVCLTGDAGLDLTASFTQATRLLHQGHHQEGNQTLDRALEHYDWRRLYNQLARLKQANPEIRTFHVAADPNIPYAALVRVFDVARTRLEHDAYHDASAFWAASPRKGDAKSVALFDDPIISIIQ